MTVGVSPRRYAGWEPRTRYVYDAQGRVAWTEPEPEWDEWDQALLDAWLDWQAGVHTCGHHESEQLNPDAEFVASFTTCKACVALQRKQESQATADKPELKKGRNPDYPRRWRVDLRSRAQLAAELAAASTQKSPMQRMYEAVAALDQAGPGSLPST